MTETSQELCRLCREILPVYGIEVAVCARNGVVAYQEIARRSPDAVLLDIFMPGMDALTLKRKYDEEHPEALTLFYVTGTFQNEGIERELMENGFGFYFLKPFSVEVFAQRLIEGHKRMGSGVSLLRRPVFTPARVAEELLLILDIDRRSAGYSALVNYLSFVCLTDEVVGNSVQDVLESLDGYLRKQSNNRRAWLPLVARSLAPMLREERILQVLYGKDGAKELTGGAEECLLMLCRQVRAAWEGSAGARLI